MARDKSHKDPSDKRDPSHFGRGKTRSEKKKKDTMSDFITYVESDLDQLIYPHQKRFADLVREMRGSFENKEDLYRFIFGGLPLPKSPHPDEVITEDQAPEIALELSQRYGDKKLLAAIIRALTEMGDLASVVMIARADLERTIGQYVYTSSRTRRPNDDF